MYMQRIPTPVRSINQRPHPCVCRDSCEAHVTTHVTRHRGAEPIQDHGSDPGPDETAKSLTANIRRISLASRTTDHSHHQCNSSHTLWARALDARPGRGERETSMPVAACVPGGRDGTKRDNRSIRPRRACQIRSTNTTDRSRPTPQVLRPPSSIILLLLRASSVASNGRP